jgi:arylsulfatase A
MLHFILVTALAAGEPPNVVIIFADDLGYGDLGCYGAKGWATPNIDRLAKEGVRFTDFYVAQPVCSASRAALLTGCYPNRVGIQGALGPAATHGLAASETTLAEVLKAKGYATAAIGKWHLGHRPAYLPTRHGFDQYFGLPYSNDMWPLHPEAKKGAYPPLPLFDGESVVDAEVTAADQETLTKRYTERSIKFIAESRGKPFFLYFAHSFPHVPLYVGERFTGSSKQGRYGDVIQEIDWSVGEVMKALAEAGVEKNTLVIFTSDNGPWLSYGNHAGSAGGLREGKGTVWEGGVRVPFVARWPESIPAGAVQSEPAMTIDLLPTIARLVGADLPKRAVDGGDVGPLLRVEKGGSNAERAYHFYYNANELQAVRKGRWKLILPHAYRTMNGQAPGKDGRPGKYRMVKAGLELYDLVEDPAETRDLATQRPDVVASLQKDVEAARADLGDSLTGRIGAGIRAKSPGKKSPDRKSP